MALGFFFRGFLLSRLSHFAKSLLGLSRTFRELRQEDQDQESEAKAKAKAKAEAEETGRNKPKQFARFLCQAWEKLAATATGQMAFRSESFAHVAGNFRR